MFSFLQNITARTWLVTGVCSAFVLLAIGLGISMTSRDWSFVHTYQVNMAQEDAESAYKNTFYNVAAQKLRFLQDTLLFQNELIGLNLAHATALKKDTSSLALYSMLFGSSDSLVKSIAQQQTGVASTRKMQSKEELEKATENFKEALRAMTNNRDARFNYEVLMRILQQQQNQQQNQDKQNQDKQNQDQQEQQKKEQQKEQDKQNEKEQKDGKKDDSEADKGQDKKEDRTDKKSNGEPQKGQITKEKAKELLAALRNNEMQYFQQPKKRKLRAKDKNVKDW